MMGRRSPIVEKTVDYSGYTQYQLLERGISSAQDLQDARHNRFIERNELGEFLARTDVSGEEKQNARAAFIIKHGRLPYQCRGCWLLPGYCVCSSLRKAQPKTKVVIHLHHDEWGRGSNTGCLCSASLSGCELLMKGHKPHDERLQALLDDPSYTKALLWPGEDALEPHQLQELAAQRSNGRIALVAIDATWDGAVRMKRRYPSDLLTVKLPPDLALPQLPEDQPLVDAIDHHHHHGRKQSQQQPATAAATAAETAAAAAAAPGSSDAGPISSAQGGDCSTSTSSSSISQRGNRAGARNQPTPGERVSLFRPVRKYHGKAADNGRVSTLEAVAAALLALENDVGMYEGLLHNLKLKVDAMRTQKHMPPVYGVSGQSVDNEVKEEAG